VMAAISCAELVEQVSAYLDGELDTATAARITNHLGGCPGCTRYTAQLRRTIHLLRGLR
jgi:anti-sigma factor RsiW